MGLGLLVALSMTWQQKDLLRLCAINRDTILRVHNQNDGRTAFQVCEWALKASEHEIDESMVEDCFEYLKMCGNK